MQRISKIKFSVTPEQEMKLWAEVLAVRNRLLINSDWTVLPDVRLRNKSEWRNWRADVRKINRKAFTRVEAEKRLADLTLQMPKTQWATDLTNLSEEELNKLKGWYIKELHYIFKNRFEDYMPFEMNYHVLFEKFEQAVDWQDDGSPENLQNYPLIQLEVQIHGKPADVVVKEFISLKQLWLTAVVRAEKELHEMIELVRNASSVVELENIISRFL